MTGYDFIPWQGALRPRAHLHTNAPVTSLDGDWAFHLVPGPHAATAGFESPTFDDATWDRLPVPSCWQMVDPAGAAPYGRPAYTNVVYPIPVPAAGTEPFVPDENPTAEYRTHFEVPASYGGLRTWLRFEGVDNLFTVWVNGTEIGWSKGSRLTAEFDITDALVEGDNVLAVRVQQWSDATFLEDQDMWWLSGIYRSVSLLGRPEFGVDDAFVHADYNHEDESGTLRVEVTRDGAPVLARVSIPELALHDAAANVEHHLHHVQSWTAETPHLYDLNVATDTEEVSLRVGFRTVRIEGDRITVNGRQIRFNGVNRHEWHPVTGRTLDEATMLRDVLLMKQHNINAVRTSHYPPDARFLDLCDEYGLWVILECDLETHGFGVLDWAGNPSADERWYPQLLNRMERTVERDKNHPAIIGWSLGNESDTGEGLRQMAEWTKHRDPSRFIHYEGDRAVDYTDVWSQMYTGIDDMDAIGRVGTLSDGSELTGGRATAPHVLCEYAHAMGNGPGELRDYSDVFDAHRRLHGGFIWEWIDHGVQAKSAGKARRGAEAADAHYLYGGDFGEELHDSNFVIDGLIFPDRTPSPGLLEFAKVIEPVRIGVSSEGIKLESRLTFADTSGARFTWSLTEDGEQVASGELDAAPLQAGEVRHLPLPALPEPQRRPDGRNAERWLLVSCRLTDGHSWAPAGHEVAFGEGPVDAVAPTAAGDTHRPISEGGSAASGLRAVPGGGWTLGAARFDQLGRLVELHDEYVSGPDLDLFRAPTDNDAIGRINNSLPGYGEGTLLGSVWRDAGLDRMHTKTVSVTATDDALQVVTHTAAAAQSRHFVTTFTWRSEGADLLLDVETHPEGDWPMMLPKIGLRWGVPGQWSRLSWFGRGPGESYRDSHEAARVGRWSLTLDELQTPYVRPQENGNRSEVRWFELGEDDGIREGIRVTADRLMDISLKPWTAEALAAATHVTDLEPDEQNWLNIDLAHAPLGSAACGPFPLARHQLHAEAMAIRLRISPLS